MYIICIKIELLLYVYIVTLHKAVEPSSCMESRDVTTQQLLNFSNIVSVHAGVIAEGENIFQEV